MGASFPKTVREAAVRAEAILAFGGWILSTLLVPASPAQTVAPADPSPSPTEVNNAALPAPSESPATEAAAASPSGDSPETPTPASSCCPSLPAAPPAEASTAEPAASEGAAATAIEAADGEGAAAAAQSFLRSPGLTPIPANRRMPPPPPSAAAVADKQNWKTLDEAGIQVIILGEYHLDPVMMQNQLHFLPQAYAQGFRTLVTEYPKAKQAELHRYLDDPTYANMAAVELGLLPDIKYPLFKAMALARLAAGFEAVEARNQQAIQRLGLRPADVAQLKGKLPMYRLWLAAHRMGYRVVAGDLDRNKGLDANGRVISDPMPNEALKYLTSSLGMKERNVSIAATIDQATARGRVLSIGGSAHTGFLPNERFSITQRPGESYPGLNYLLETEYQKPSVALAQRSLSGQGYLLHLAMGDFQTKKGDRVEAKSRWRVNQEIVRDIAQDPSRVPMGNPARPLESYLPEAVERREKVLPQIREQ